MNVHNHPPSGNGVPLAVDTVFIKATFLRPDAGELIAKHHEAIWTNARRGAAAALRRLIAQKERDASTQTVEMDKLTAHLHQTEPLVIVEGGNEVRRFGHWVSMTAWSTAGSGCIAVDYGIVYSLMEEATGAPPNPWMVSAVVASGPALVALGLKLFPVLMHDDPKKRERFAKVIAVTLLLTGPLALWCMAHRIGILSANPIAMLASGGDAAQSQFVSMFATIGTLASTALVATGCFLSVGLIARRTRNAIKQINPAYATLKADIEVAQEKLARAESELGEAQAQRAALDAELLIFLAQAESALEEERTRYHVARGRIQDERR